MRSAGSRPRLAGGGRRRIRKLIVPLALLGAAGAMAARRMRRIRREAEARAAALRRRDRILEAVGTGAERLLRHPDGHRLNDFLALVGEAADVCRVYIFENHWIRPGELAATQRYEWAAPGIPPQIQHPQLRGASYTALGMARWKSVLSAGGAILGNVDTFPESEQPLLESQGIRSLVVLPIFLGKEWWGFIGFDETRYEREWSKAEIDALKISAGLVAAVIARSRADERIRELDRERAERQAARAEERRSRFLAEASRIFAATLEPGEILERLARLVVPELADWSIVDVVEDGSLRRAAVAHADPAAAPLAAALHRSAPPRDKANPIARTAEEGSGQILQRVTVDVLVDTANAATGDRGGTADAAGHSVDAAPVEPRAAMMVPLRVRGAVAGVLTLLAKPSRLYERGDLALAEELAERASLALENAGLYAEARRATRVRDEMLAIVSHDLRNPLHTIELSAGLLEAITPRDAETARKQLEIVKRSVQRADRLIDDLLDVARLEAGTFALECGPVASVEVAREALELHRGQAEKEDERLVVALPERLPDVWADRDRLLQVFSNLLGNAIKFTPRGGRIELGAEAADEHIRFWVRDTGPGIPPDQVPHVFDPFWQAKRRLGGAGLGLAIARGIVEAHGGRIRVESELGVGTTIWFTIPTVRSHHADAGRRSRRRLDAA